MHIQIEVLTLFVENFCIIFAVLLVCLNLRRNGPTPTLMGGPVVRSYELCIET